MKRLALSLLTGLIALSGFAAPRDPVMSVIRASTVIERPVEMAQVLLPNKRRNFQTTVVGSSLLTGLVGYWPMNDTGNTADVSGGGHTMTENGAGGIASVAGKIGNARDIELADSDRFNIAEYAEIDFNGDVSFTIAFWTQLESKDTIKTAVGKYNTVGNNAQYFAAYFNGADRWQFGVSSDGSDETSAVANNFGSPTVGVFYFVVCGRNAADNTIFISVNDGTPNTVAGPATIFNGNSDLYFGRIQDGSYYDGLLDEVGIWSRVLSGAEISYLYNLGNGRTHPFD